MYRYDIHKDETNNCPNEHKINQCLHYILYGLNVVLTYNYLARFIFVISHKLQICNIL